MSAFVLALLPISSVCAEETQIIYINNENELYMLEEYPFAEFHLMNDIYIIDEHDVMFKSEDSAFMGVLDGKGYSILFLNVSGDSDAVAFIGHSKGVIKNLNFSDSSVNANNADAVVSGVVGINYGDIENCTFKGEIKRCGELVNGNPIYGRNKVSISGFDENSSQIDSSLSESEVSSSTTSSVLVSSSAVSVSSSKVSSVSDDSSVLETSSEIEAFGTVVDESEDNNTDTIGLIIVLISSFLLLAVLVYAVYKEIKRSRSDKKDKK